MKHTVGSEGHHNPHRHQVLGLWGKLLPTLCSVFISLYHLPHALGRDETLWRVVVGQGTYPGLQNLGVESRISHPACLYLSISPCWLQQKFYMPLHVWAFTVTSQMPPLVSGSRLGDLRTGIQTCQISSYAQDMSHLTRFKVNIWGISNVGQLWGCGWSQGVWSSLNMWRISPGLHRTWGAVINLDKQANKFTNENMTAF